MQIGDINIVDSIINLEISAQVHDNILSFILNNNYSLTKPSDAQIKQFRTQAIANLNKRYPTLGIQDNLK